jgi:hypothetical protein
MSPNPKTCKNGCGMAPRRIARGYKKAGGDQSRGEFCSIRCAKSYATKARRKEISARVSQTMLARRKKGLAVGVYKGRTPTFGEWLPRIKA